MAKDAVLLSEGIFFFTDVDPEAALKDSRDPLGLQPIWSHFGRKLVGNLTTVTTSVRGFTTLLLGHWVAEQLVESGKIPAAEYIQPFLRFEQLAAYSRFAWAAQTGDPANTIRGIRRVEGRFAEGKGRIRIAADRDGQILSNQKTYGLWGLYSVAAESSGLLRPKRDGVSPRALDFLEKRILPIIDTEVKGGRDTILRSMASPEFYFEPRSKDRQLGKTLATLLSPIFNLREREFYGDHLVYGIHCHRDGRQKRLWERVAEYNRKGSWQNPFDMKELEAIASRCGSSADALDLMIAEWLEKIRLLELVLAPAEQVFDFLLGQRGQSLDSVKKELKRRWGGAFKHLDPAGLGELTPALTEALGEIGTGTMSRLKDLSLNLQDGHFDEVARLVLLQNEEVMQRRGGGAWARIANNRIEVRYSDQTGEPMPSDQLRQAWHNTYFLNALKVVGTAVFMKGNNK